MPIVSAALLPHSPLLIPTIGKGARDQLSKTVDGLDRMKSSCAALEPDTVILIKTPERGHRRRSVFQIQLPQSYTVDFSEFGDLITKGEFPCDTVLGTELKTSVRNKDLSLTYVSDGKLEYTASVPLISLFSGLSIKVIVIQPPDTEPSKLFAFGKALTAVLQESQKRIVCLAAGDCAHCVRNGKKEGYEHLCLPFDYMFIDALQKRTSDALCAIKREEIRTLNACAVPPSIVLKGILDSLSWKAQLLSYEAPFGVGYTVLEFQV